MQAMTGMMYMSGEEQHKNPIKVGFPLIDGATGIISALAIVSAIAGRRKSEIAQYIDASMLDSSLALMYPSASAFLTERSEPLRLGNRGYTGSPTADTYKCLDGWLAVGANTPKQFRKFSELLGLQYLCEDPKAIDIAAFNSPGSAFVIANDFTYVQNQFRAALIDKSAYEMEYVLNSNSVPAARVRKLSEFLDEIDNGFYGWIPNSYKSGDREVRTPGLGFKFESQASDSDEFAPGLGQSNVPILKSLGYSENEITELKNKGIIPD